MLIVSVTPNLMSTTSQILETWGKRLQKLQEDTLLEQIRVCSELGIQCVEFNPANRPTTKHMIDRLDEVSMMDGSMKIGVSSTSAIARVCRTTHETCSW